MGKIIVDKLEFRRESGAFTVLYTVAGVLTLGSLSVYHVFYPVFGHRFKSYPCHPSEADIVIVTLRQSKLDHQEFAIAPVALHKNSDELLLSFEIDGLRFCCCSTGKYFHCL